MRKYEDDLRSKMVYPTHVSNIMSNDILALVTMISRKFQSIQNPLRPVSFQ